MVYPSEIRPASYGRCPRALTENRSERRFVCNSPTSAIPKTSPHTRPRPGRRRCLSPAFSTLQLFLCSVVLLSLLCVPANATRSYDGRRRQRYGRVPSPRLRFEYVEPDLDSFRPGEIVHDRRYPVVQVHDDIYKRQDALDMGGNSKGGSAKTTGQKQLKFSSTSTASPAATTAAAFTTVSLPDTTSTSSSPTEPTQLVTAPGTGSSSLPRPFDTGLGNNYTNPNCPVFINNFLRNDTFISCLPLSLLLQNSMSFFSATKSLASITRTLDATCAVVEPTCSTVLSSFAAELRTDSNCGSDYRRQQPIVLSAYNGLISYAPLFRAGCEKDTSGTYCFANAIQNMTSPTDSYPYYLPLGIALPGGSQPTCSSCLKKTMDIFNQAANGEKAQQPLAGDYAGAAQMINVGCGPGFANVTMAASKGAGQSSGAVTRLGGPLFATTVVLAFMSSIITLVGVLG